MGPIEDLDAVDKRIFLTLSGNQTPVVEAIAKRYCMKTMSLTCPPVISISVFLPMRRKAKRALFAETNSVCPQIFVSGYLRNT
jgi:hypothetical protein